MRERRQSVIESLESRQLYSAGAATAVEQNTVSVKITSIWNNVYLIIDGNSVIRDARGRISLAANSTHEVKFAADGHTRKLDYLFKSAKKTGGAGTFRQTGGTDAAPVYTISTGTKGMTIAARYSTHRVSRETAGGSSGVIVRYTYAGDANLDGKVDIGDLSLLAGAWQQLTSEVWVDGESDLGGDVALG